MLAAKGMKGVDIIANWTSYAAATIGADAATLAALYTGLDSHKSESRVK